MANFINKIKKIWKIFKNATRHQIWLFVGTLIFMFIFDILGMGVLASIIFGLFVGTVIEVIHCYIPIKQVKILWFTINIPDFKSFRENWKSDNYIPNDTIDTDGIYFNVVAIILYFILKILYVIIF